MRYLVISEFVQHRPEYRRISPGAPGAPGVYVELGDDDGRRLVKAGCLLPAENPEQPSATDTPPQELHTKSATKPRAKKRK